MTLDTTRLRNPAIKDWADEHLNYASRLVYLGAPALADVDYIVESANMKVGAYTVAHSPDIPRVITVTHTAVDAADTLGTIDVVGTDIGGNAITETITPSSGTTVSGTQAFKTVTSVTGAGWVINAGNDTITVGFGTALGLPFKIDATSEVTLGILGTTVYAPTVTADIDELCKCTADLSSGTYNGTKKAYVFAVE